MFKPETKQVLKQTKMTDLFKTVSSTITSTKIDPVTLVPSHPHRLPSIEEEEPSTKKLKGTPKQLPPNLDPYHESHKSPKIGLHYVKRDGIYYCLGPALKKPELGGFCGFTGATSVKVHSHARHCWPNISSNEAKQNKSSKNYLENEKRRKAKYRVNQLNKLQEALDRGESPALSCSFNGCDFVTFTQLQLTRHVQDFHKKMNLAAFLLSPEWGGPCLPENHNQDLTELTLQFNNFIANRRMCLNFAYIAIFVQNSLDSVDKVWTFLEANSTNSAIFVPFYVGKGIGIGTSQFSIEVFHHSSRETSTIFKYIKQNKMRAYQLIAIPFKCDDVAASQEAIFQMIGFLSKNKDPRPDSINYTIINGKAELTNWEKLSKEDSARALDSGLQRQPLLCLDKNCPHKTHQTPGNFSFGKFHRTEVKLVPFEYEKYL